METWGKTFGIVYSKKNEKIQTDPRIKELGEAKYHEYRKWFDQRLENAVKAAEERALLDNNQESPTREWEGLLENAILFLPIQL